ncbi:GNAT family N-acetyltransferase [Patescibacteria group bacterium]|nr:GNAT family N-acetyltransferase [Patescibacteria group bacterium]
MMYDYDWDRIRIWLEQYGAIGEEVTQASEITRLDLSGHSIKELPESIGVLSQLLVLNLSNNHLTSLPESMKKLQKLSNLDLRRNKFEVLPNVLTLLPLRSINLSGNKITTLPPLSAFVELRVLDMSSNLIDNIGDALSSENQLRALNLSSNYIKKFEVEESCLQELLRLNLRGNLLSEISETFSTMENLEEIDLSDNRIERIDESFFELDVQLLDLSVNKLSSLHLFGLDSLEEIILDDNALESLTIDEAFAPDLREFSCEGCGLEEMILPPSKNLELLCYSSNEILSIPESIGNYTKLSQLDIESNNIVDLPDTLANLIHLQTLYIQNNPLSEGAKKVIEILAPDICDIHMKTGISIEKASKEDLPQMAKLLSVLFEIETDFTIDYEKQLAGIVQLFEYEGADLLVAKDKDNVVGMVTMQRLISSAEGGFVGQIEDLVVQAEYRKMGVGSRLINKMRSIAQEYSYKRIQLAADVDNKNALEFYNRRGFVKTHLNIYHYKV